jgi:hypothetical protein
MPLYYEPYSYPLFAPRKSQRRCNSIHSPGCSYRRTERIARYKQKLIEFQSVVPVNVLAMTTCSQAYVCHRLRVFNASCEPGRILLVHLDFPDLHPGHVHTSWNPSNIWISHLWENFNPFVHQKQINCCLEHLVERIRIMDNPLEQAKEILDRVHWQAIECNIRSNSKQPNVCWECCSGLIRPRFRSAVRPRWHKRNGDSSQTVAVAPRALKSCHTVRTELCQRTTSITELPLRKPWPSFNCRKKCVMPIGTDSLIMATIRSRWSAFSNATITGMPRAPLFTSFLYIESSGSLSLQSRDSISYRLSINPLF